MLGFVLHVVASGLGVQPLAHAPLLGAGLVGQFGGGERAAAGQSPEQTQAIAKYDQGSAEPRPEITHHLGGEITVRNAPICQAGRWGHGHLLWCGVRVLRRPS